MLESSELGPLPVFKYVSPDCLIIDDRYQRSIANTAGRRVIKNIVEHFNWIYFVVLMVTDNGDGTYNVIDGQHRTVSAQIHSKVDLVPVMIIPEMTLAEQAKAFVAINQGRVKLNALQLHKAAIKAGDPNAITLSAITEECGIHIPNNIVSSKMMKPGQTLAVSTLLKILAKYQAAGLKLTLETTMAAYGNRAGNLRAQIFNAVSIAVHKYPKYTDHIAKVLGSKDAEAWEVLGRTHNRETGKTVPIAIADLITSGIENAHEDECNNQAKVASATELKSEPPKAKPVVSKPLQSPKEEAVLPEPKDYSDVEYSKPRIGASRNTSTLPKVKSVFGEASSIITGNATGDDLLDKVIKYLDHRGFEVQVFSGLFDITEGLRYIKEELSREELIKFANKFRQSAGLELFSET